MAESDPYTVYAGPGLARTSECRYLGIKGISENDLSQIGI